MNEREIGLGIAYRMAEQEYIQYDRDIIRQQGTMYSFRQELIENGFRFRYLHDSLAYMPKEKEIIVPIVCKYFRAADSINDRRTLRKWLYFSGLYDAVPTLLDEFFINNLGGNEGYLWEIADTLYVIRCSEYAKEYMEIVQNAKFGHARQMLVLLLGRIKCYESEPILRSLLSVDDLTLHVISAMGSCGGKECLNDLEPFLHPAKKRNVILTARRKEAEKAIARIEKRLEKQTSKE